MDLSYTIEELAEITRPGRISGSGSGRIRGIASLGVAGEGDLSFLANKKYRHEVPATKASVVLVPGDYDGEPSNGQVLFFHENPSLALAMVCQRIEQRLWPRPAPGVHPSAVVAVDAELGEGVSVGPGCVIGEGASIGDGVVLQAQCHVGRHTRVGKDGYWAPRVTVLDYCEIGERVRLDSGVVVGSDGFGYATVAGRHEKLPQIGRVVIGDDVEIGANTTIDRARFDRTEIGEGTKIDNMVQIGHNVIVGKHCFLVSQVGIAGSTVVGNYVVMGGQAGVAGHLTIGDGVMIGAQSGVGKDLPPKSFVSGSPAVKHMLNLRVVNLLTRLPDLFRDVDRLRDEVKKLSSAP